MRRDIGSSYTAATGTASGLTGIAAGANNSASVDHSLGQTAMFIIEVGDEGVAGTVDVKLQFSDDDSTFTDATAGLGNDATLPQITAAGIYTVNVGNPEKRYSRVVSTVATNAVAMSVVSLVGPLRTIVPADA